jgi:DNA-binding NtrC family response regulator
MQARVLVVEDDAEVRTLLVRTLRRRGYSVEEAADGMEGLACAKRAAPDVVLTDMTMPRLDGLGLMKALRQTDSDLPVIVLTGHGSMENVLQAMREGVLFDYLMKPLPDLTLMEVAVLRAVEVRRLRARAREADQVTAMRELAVTAADRVLNPLNVISLSLESLKREGSSPEARAKAVTGIERAVAAITRVVRQMAIIARYASREVHQGLCEIDLDTATAQEQEGE